MDEIKPMDELEFIVELEGDIVGVRRMLALVVQRDTTPPHTRTLLFNVLNGLETLHNKVQDAEKHLLKGYTTNNEA